MNAACLHVISVLALAGLGAAPLSAQQAAEPGLVVFAAASLSGAFQELGRAFERTHPGTRVTLNLAGSQQLAVQIEQGAQADLFASADERWMRYLEDKRLLAERPRLFARNRLVLVVPASNPARIGKLQDLARRGVKIVIGAEAVPVGAYTRRMLARLVKAPGFPADFDRRVLANVVSEEENVKAVVTKVQLGEADAGIAYASDVAGPGTRHLRTIAIPGDQNVTAEYPMARLASSEAPEAAAAFTKLVLGPEGQAVLRSFGLVAVARPSSMVPPASR
ncbi:MAG TPA: molybdate ABC transporter substrate-binding protein [Gemmatimonadales bacterium]|nr:molybdate ABC transporter substrate-binding protein [Gemmatimonadales bacterium]